VAGLPFIVPAQPGAAESISAPGDGLRVDQLLSLDATALATGQPARRLRTWCATGKLACEKDGDQWVVPLSQLLRVAQLAAERTAAIAEGRPIAVIVPVTAATPDLATEIAHRLGMPTHTVSMSMLALDGGEYLMAVWRTDGARAPELAPVMELVDTLGGELLDGEAQEMEQTG
jgi:hypothetical protein